MADAPETETDSAEGHGAEGGKSSKKKLIIIIVAALLLIGGLVGGLFVSGVLGGKKAAPKEGAEHSESDKAKDGKDAEAGPSVFYEMPDMIVNLSGDGGKQRFLKISITLELSSSADTKTIEAVLPRVTDHFQTYLRELRLDDLRGSAGLYRLRQELLDRVHSASGVDVKDVLFEEILVQ